MPTAMAAKSAVRLVAKAEPTAATAKVVDASALGALLFGEPDAEAMAERLSGTRLFAPALLFFELANICLKKVKRHPKQRDALVVALDLAAGLGITVADVAQPNIVRLADETGLTAYDAAYLWLARHLGAELVTLDKQLLKAL
ncbi:MAG: type II toxin-antitoxin system VapC family toxin [Rhodospirillaceae bacterium]|nr:type II toxin-antitoxin system VapC family toxin [Rhodospirillaceae bacterium]